MPTMTKSDTFELLLRLLAVTWDSSRPELPGDIPWPQVLDLARAHGVSPLLRGAARTLDLAVPPEVQLELDRAYFHTAVANSQRLEELGQILAEYSAAGVPVLLLKGAALAADAYHNVALRPMGDFDLLIAPEHVPAAGAMLQARGYACTEVEVAPGAHLAYRNEQAFIRRDPHHVMVELHWHLVDVPYYIRRLPVAWFWQHSHPIDVEGREVLALDAEANLLYLAAHLALHHRFHGLRWFVDLALRIAGQARQFELLQVLRETLARLEAYWPGLPLSEARGRLEALHPTATERRIFRLLLAEPRSPLLDFYADLVCLPDLPARLRFAVANVFPQPAYMRRRYPVRAGWHLPYWYLHRLLFGLLNLARTVPQALKLEKPARAG